MSPVRVALILGVVSIGFGQRAWSQTAQAPEAIAPIAPCGMERQTADHFVVINKNGALYQKIAGDARMNNIGPTTWAICNNTTDLLRVRFSRVTCDNIPPTTCPASFAHVNPADRCGAEARTNNGSRPEIIPPQQWAFVTGSPNGNRTPCPDEIEDVIDIYDFSVEVQRVKEDGSPEGAPQTIDPELQIDNNRRSIGRVIRQDWMWLLLFLGIGIVLGFVAARALSVRRRT